MSTIAIGNSVDRTDRRSGRRTSFFIFILIVITFMGTGMQPAYSLDYSSSSKTELVIDLPENYEARNAFRTTLLRDLDDSTRIASSTMDQRREKSKVMFRIDRSSSHLFYVFLDESAAGFGLENAGNVSLKRDRADGRFVQMTVLLRDGTQCYAKLNPEGEKTSLSVFLYDVLLYHNVLLPIKFERIIFEPFRSVATMTCDMIDWYTILGARDAGDFKALRAVIDSVREKLPRFDDVDDGASDAVGTFRFISKPGVQESKNGFNCSGFVKWIIDGFYYPLAGSYIGIDELKEKHPGYRGNRWTDRYEKERDPFFGLDWTRNCALVLDRARGGGVPRTPESFDVRSVPFTSYVEDVGYPVSQLQLVLFLLALDHPGAFYLGSINSEFGARPVLHQHFHVVALVPLFDEGGRFRTIVLERTAENSVGSLEKRYNGMNIHLVRIDPPSEFRPLVP